MRRMGAIVRRLYAEELKSAPDKRSASPAPGRWSGTRRRLSRIRKAIFRRRSVVWALRIIAILTLLFVVAETIFQFNRLTSWNTVVMARRADVDRELKRRGNLLPNLIYAVSQYATYEQGVFRYVADAREALKMMQGPDVRKTPASTVLERILPRLVALAEQYPDLKTSAAIQDLITEASNTENRIADAKQDYNKAAEIYNQYCTTFPGNFFAVVFDFESVGYMGLEEEVEVPAMELNVVRGSAGGGAPEG